MRRLSSTYLEGRTRRNIYGDKGGMVMNIDHKVNVCGRVMMGKGRSSPMTKGKGIRKRKGKGVDLYVTVVRHPDCQWYLTGV
jgi:hypothetical protein